jgi:hypothetical protein
MSFRNRAGITYVEEAVPLRELMILCVVLTIVVVAIYISFS